MNGSEKLQWVYDQEMHVSMKWIWDAGVDWQIGWPDIIDSGNVSTVDEAIEEIYLATVDYEKTSI